MRIPSAPVSTAIWVVLATFAAGTCCTTSDSRATTQAEALGDPVSGTLRRAGRHQHHLPHPERVDLVWDVFDPTRTEEDPLRVQVELEPFFPGHGASTSMTVQRYVAPDPSTMARAAHLPLRSGRRSSTTGMRPGPSIRTRAGAVCGVILSLLA